MQVSWLEFAKVCSMNIDNWMMKKYKVGEKGRESIFIVKDAVEKKKPTNPHFN